MRNLQPNNAIIPILRLGPENEFIELLGTGFFAGSRPVVVTAKHVFLDNPLGEGENYGFANERSIEEQTLGIISQYLQCPNYDIAVFNATSCPGAVPLSFAKKNFPTNLDILTYEFSSTYKETEGDGITIVHFTPYTHKGNILRHYISNYPEHIPTPVFDTSFPALQGASGAPVLCATDFSVVGMLLANHERHLIPAQTVELKGKDGTLEEKTSYFLPTGKALEASVIIEYLDQIKAEPTVLEK